MHSDVFSSLISKAKGSVLSMLAFGKHDLKNLTKLISQHSAMLI